MCKACEVGKHVVNICVERKYSINTAKLQKLLTLMHGYHLKSYNEPLFPENIVLWPCGVAIKEVDEKFREFAKSFPQDKLPALLALLESEETVIEKVIDEFGNKDVFNINADSRLKMLSEGYSPERKGEVIDNEKIKKVFSNYELL